MGLIDRYILRAVVTPLLLALCVAGMLLLLEQMLRLFDFVLAEQGPVDVVWRMLANLLPHYLGLALPLGAFLGVLLAFRSLSLSSELDALNSSGASVMRLLRPVYLLTFALMIFDFLLVSYIQPYAQYEYEQIRFDVTSGALGIKIPQGEFVAIADDATIRLGKVNTETRDAEDIFLERRDRAGGVTTITARYGGISTTPEITKLLLKLREGRQVYVDHAGERANAGSFDSFDIEIDLPAIAVFRSRGGTEREATFDELWTLVRTQSPQTEPRWHDYRAGFHWRLIHPLTFLVLPILAVAMGVTGRRRASNLKPILGVAILIVYHELVEEWGQVVAGEGRISPYISMWGLFVVFLAISIFLYRGSIDQARTARVMSRREEPTVRVLSAPAEDGEVDDLVAARGPAQ
ncbi:MAG: YjgP/YjgQ family permease [Rhodomicrobium sp.]|nr:YjgP/YjgQ family permease [Rhodomicrobium sp.]